MNETALKERLKIVAKEKGVSFSDCWKQLLLERFLARIAKSKHKDKLVFKGGFLLSYVLETERETVDLDFLLTRMKAKADEIREMLESIASVDLSDGFSFAWSRQEELTQPHMEYRGFRIHLSATLGKIRDAVQIDLGIGDDVTPKMQKLKLFSYKGKPIFEGEISLLVYSLLVYPLEAVFSEKLHPLISHGKANSRMKDYHDLLVMIRNEALKPGATKKAIQTTFGQREQQFSFPILFPKKARERCLLSRRPDTVFWRRCQGRT